ncbi:MAG: hypothetical protein LBF77_05830 [Spirochaetaceae bacterium]|jgi:transcriptional regulator with XRE-family HTH domain|nr:hypothetical protein [Spirochaetaceae bacterium]
MLSRGKYKPSREVLTRLAHLYRVDLTWFITGEGGDEAGPGLAAIALVEQAAATGQGREIENYPDRRMIRVLRELISHYNSSTLSALFIFGDSMMDEKINVTIQSG